METPETTSIEGLLIHLKYIREELADIKQTLSDFKNNYVTKEEFAPVKNLVFGMTALILTSVVGALLTLILRK